jgi:hypothetical protein
MHLLVELHGQPGWVAALTPLSVDGMIMAASTTLLADSRAGQRGGVLPWALLVARSAASLAANVAVAEPAATGRVIAAWPSFALIVAYELLMRQVRRSAAASGMARLGKPGPQVSGRESSGGDVRPRRRLRGAGQDGGGSGGRGGVGGDLRWQAWQWALANWRTGPAPGREGRTGHTRMTDRGPDRRDHRWTTRLRRGLPDQGNRISGAVRSRAALGPVA